MSELYHYGVPGMKWGVRRRRGLGIVADKPKGDRGNWGRDPMSKRKQKWIDDNGFNPNRPYGTKPGMTTAKKTTRGKEVANKVLKGAIAGVGVGAVAVALAPAVAIGWGAVRMITGD